MSVVGPDSWTRWPPAELVTLLAIPELFSGDLEAVDIGCGEGTEAIFLASRGWQVLALDPDSEAIQTAKKRAEKILPDYSIISNENPRFIRSNNPSQYILNKYKRRKVKLVIERLIYVNLYEDDPKAATNIIKAAVHFLLEGGFFMMRFAYELDSWNPWGEEPECPLLSPRDLRLLNRYFVSGPELYFAGLSTPRFEPDEDCCCTIPRWQSLVLMRRNGRPFFGKYTI